jgi:large subunit ribosomal protein L31
VKKDIHPKYGECTVTCACGNAFTTRATVNALKIEICGQCHPFYTGKQKIVDTEGRVERFRQRQLLAQQARANAVDKEAKRKARDEARASKRG